MSNPVYLYKIYKVIKQRETRMPWYCSKSEVELRSKMVTVARTIFEGKKTASDILKIARELKSYEVKLPRIQTLCSQQIINAVKNKTYSLEKPDHIHWRDNSDAYGYVYVFITESKEGQCKLGATTLYPYDRLSKYVAKYGYNVDLFYYSELIENPYKLEKIISDEIGHSRVSSNTEGDSNEWYYIEPSSLRAYIIRAIKEKRN